MQPYVCGLIFGLAFLIKMGHDLIIISHHSYFCTEHVKIEYLAQVRMRKVDPLRR